MSGQRIVEGVFAINKPPSLSSAQILRELQHVFNRSALFRPWIKAQEASRADELRRNPRQRSRRNRNKRIEVKLGHGGTLDPMATGVLIVGIGKGTKSLSQFLECTKSYETSVLFGASTDTYDVSGRILARAEYAHLTKVAVESAIEKFRGNIKQKPPLYSALRVQGKKLYEYAREGLEVPAEIEERAMQVDEMKLLEWLEPGEHDVRWPVQDAQPDEKAIAKGLLGVDADEEQTSTSKRKRDADDPDEGYDQAASTQRKAVKLDRDVVPPSSGDVPNSQENPTAGPQTPVEVVSGESLPQSEEKTALKPHPKRELHFHDNMPPKTSPKADAPVAKVFMTVSSGFYVRSFCHDLGKAVGSVGLMATLVRSRQGQFELGKNVLDFDEFSRDEAVWGPKVEAMLDDWNNSDKDPE